MITNKRLSKLYNLLSKHEKKTFENGDTILFIKNGFGVWNKKGELLKTLNVKDFTATGGKGHKITDDNLLLDMILDELKNY